MTASITARDLAGIAIAIFGISLLIEGAQNLVSAAYTIAAQLAWDEMGFLTHLMQVRKEEVLRAAVLIFGGALLLWKREDLRDWMVR